MPTMQLHAPLIVLSILLIMAAPSLCLAEDADRFRPYFRFGNGDIGSNWGVYDHWSLGIGANAGSHWGGELAIDNYERKFRDGGRELGEISGWHLVPQLRLRQPLLASRLVPYMVAGTGVSFLEFKDEEASEAALGRRVKIKGSTWAITAGAGVDYFLSDNVALNVEGRYFWLQRVSGTVDGRRVHADLSTPTLTASLRVFTDLNRPRPLADAQEEHAGRGYLGFRLGGAVLTDDRLNRDVQLTTDSPSVGEVSQSGGLLFGWDFGRHWGIDVAFNFLEFTTRFDGRDIGEYAMKMVIPQARYRMPLAGGRWVPYLEAGMGGSFNEFNDRTAQGYGLEVDARGFYPVSAAGGGVEYFLNRNLCLLADLSWLYSWRQGFRAGSAGGSDGDSSVLLAQLGVRAYLFD